MIASIPGASELDSTALGWFDYAHLRAPLPKGIVSGIFKSSPPSYFLMRRSQDGFVSATGMFKATFPYASQEEEETERKFVKSLPATSHDETAGNVWIPPDEALVLAEEYKILPWIRALLDPSEISITPGADNSPPKKIVPPPKFFSGAPAFTVPAAASAPVATRTSTRSRRSVSPTKSATGSRRSVASPRKRRVASSQSSITTDVHLSESQSPTLVNGEIPSQTQVPILPRPTTAKIEEVDDIVKVESIEKDSTSALPSVEEEPKIKVQVDEDIKIGKNGEEVKHTKVEVDIPLLGELPSAEDAAKMVAEARAMVEAATKTIVDELPAAGAKSKRKADEIAVDEDEKNEEGVVEQPRAKKVKTEAEIRKEKIRKRAYLGLTATFAVGAVGYVYLIVFLRSVANLSGQCASSRHRTLRYECVLEAFHLVRHQRVNAGLRSHDPRRGAVGAYGWLWSCCEDVEKGRRAMLSLVLDPLSEFGCDFFRVSCFYMHIPPRHLLFFRRIPPFLSGSTVGLPLDIGSPTDLFWNLGTGRLDGIPRGRKSRYLGITSRATFASEDTKRRDGGLEPASGFWLFNLGGHLAAAGGLPQICPL